MKRITATLALILLFTFLLSGCVSYNSQLRIEELSKKLTELQTQIGDKIVKARTGELTTGEALEFIRHAEAEVKSAKDELRSIKAKEKIGWAEIIGAVLASMLGTSGIMRAWRGPTHKNINIATP